MTGRSAGAPVANPEPEARSLLRRITIVAVVDFILLVPLVVGAVTDNHGLAPILGPIHGAGFLYDVFLAVRGAAERWWGWWYPAVIFVTGGPLGALLGHRRAEREASTPE